jgi:phage shock protein C
MADMSGRNGTKILVRSRDDRMVAGICAGVAKYFGIDVTMVRVILVVVCLITGGAGILAYLVAWAIIPEESETSTAENAASEKQDAARGLRRERARAEARR